ncbi:Transketolase [Hamiltosporidium tvaerminnensis]|nr:Transketolase [Hamiltosporidium tvaerminnensis]
MSDILSINNIRVLCAEMVEEAKSGHPGAPLGLAPFVYILFKNYIRFDPEDSKWINRDIFIFSNGHACTLEYVIRHLCGYKIGLEDLKKFRQLGSITPGHPEFGVTDGVEASTGPLGQGISNAVGYAIALEKMKLYNKESLFIFDNRVYCIFGDGCYQEGISHEAFALAGHLKLSNLTFIYDSNKITIDGPTSLSMSDDSVLRFKSYGFEVEIIEDGDSDLKKMEEILNKKITKTKVIILNTTIGKFSELEGNAKVHGAPLGMENLKKLKEKLNFGEEKFLVKNEVKEIFKEVIQRNKENRKVWNEKIKKYRIKFPEIYDEIFRKEKTVLKISYENQSGKIATRKHFSDALNENISKFKHLIGGSADLTPSNLTKWKESEDFTAENRKGNYIRFGIREHAMMGICNGISYFGHHFVFCGTFLNFITYGFPSLRLACLTNLKVLYVMTHDSIGLGEDGPTHQPIEVLSLLRATPNLTVLRPADGRETRFCLKFAYEKDGPTVVCLSRQNLPDLNNSSIDLSYNGAYFIKESENPEIILISTGSEVCLALECAEILQKKNKKVSVVSMISFELFEKQSESYKQKILPPKVIKISIEASSTFGWQKYSNFQIGIDSFGKSAKYEDIYDYFGFTPDKLSDRILSLLQVNFNC